MQKVEDHVTVLLRGDRMMPARQLMYPCEEGLDVDRELAYIDKDAYHGTRSSLIIASRFTDACLLSGRYRVGFCRAAAS